MCLPFVQADVCRAEHHAICSPSTLSLSVASATPFLSAASAERSQLPSGLWNLIPVASGALVSTLCHLGLLLVLVPFFFPEGTKVSWARGAGERL